MIPSILSDLEAVLQQERSALLTGDYPQLARLTAKKEALTEAIERRSDIEVEAGELRRLNHSLDRNLALLDAALGGARDAIARLQDLPRSASGFETYDSTGKPTRVAVRSTQVERKA